MSARLAFLLVPLTLLLVVFLGLGSQIRHGDEDTRVLEDVRVMRELDARLGRAVLQAHDGLTQSYDDLGGTLAEMWAAQRDIEAVTARVPDPGSATAVRRVRESMSTKADLVDRFESRNSMVRNSLAYLERSARRAATVRGTAADEAIARRCVLLLASAVDNENTHGAGALAELGREADALAVLRAGSDARELAAVDAVLLHARLYARQAPALEEAVEQLLSDDGHALTELQSLTQARLARSTTVANRYRVALASLSVLLLGAVAVVLGRLRGKRRELATLNLHLEERVATRTHDLETSREQYRELLESTQAIPWVMEPGSLRFAYVGPQATRLLGFPAEAWQAEGFLAKQLHPDDVDATLLAFLESRSANDQEVELRMIAADGRCLWLRSLVSATRDPRGRTVRRGILLDVTARRALEEKLSIAQKLESVGRLAAGVAHEINTPVQFVSDNVHFTRGALGTMMTLLGTYGTLLGDERLTSAERAAAAKAAREEADIEYVAEEAPRAIEGSIEGLERIATIVRSLTDFSHPDGPRMAPADLNESVKTTLTVARSEYTDVAELVLDLDDLPPVVCHIGQINQVLLVLTVNASQAIAGSGAGLGRITVRTRWDGTHVLLSVTDTGGGIPDHVRGRIFDPFFTTKRLGEGTGQGLAIAHSIVVDTHRGDLSFETEVGRGTTFHVRLPAARESSHAVAS